MNPAQLLAHFDRLAEAPDAIPRLRRFILDLAVRGKLVEQNFKDEPASELLKRIRSQKARLIREGSIRREYVSAKIGEESLPFPLPARWTWARLGEVIHLVGGQHLQPGEYSDDEESGPPYITGPADFGEDGLLISRYAIVRKAFARVGQILLTVKGAGVGKTAICNLPEVAISRQLMAITPIQWDAGFLTLVTDRLADSLKAAARSLIPGISREDVQDFVFAFPPLPEQHRIVAKVDELMGLCDRLEAAQAQRERRRDRLAAASLHRLNRLDGDAQAFRAHARFHLDHLPSFTVRPDQIPALRQTILNLAVCGRLASQDPKDEPAIVLINRIKHEKEQLIKQKAIKLSNSHTHRNRITETADLPRGWQWVTLDEITDIGTGSTPPKASRDYYADGTVPWVTSSATNNEFITVPEQYVTQLAVMECRLNLYPAGSLIVALYGQGKTRGQVGQLTFDSTTNQACAVVVFFGSGILNRDYIRVVLKKKYHEMREMAAGGPQPNLSGGLIRMTSIPLPPLAEQRRIVAKVDELMAVCDRLESQLSTAQTESRRLLEAVLHEALASESGAGNGVGQSAVRRVGR